MGSKDKVTLSLMSPLLVGDPREPTSIATIQARDQLRRNLELLRKTGFEGAVATDLWAAIIEPKPAEYDWRLGDWVLDTLIEFGLKWNPIDSEHQCGGNVGDDVYVPQAQWVWDYLVSNLPGSTPRDFMFVSEQGNACPEYVGFWADALMMPLRIRRWKAFCEHFADRAEHIAEITLSMGPAGEIRYPSYNSHDLSTDYPSRGALQCYSKFAIESFRQFALRKYGSRSRVEVAWGLKSGQPIMPPSDARLFFERSDHLNTQYGRDFFDWYAGVLRGHVREVLTGAFSVFASADSPMRGIDIGVKLPGVHWLTGRWHFDDQAACLKLAIEVGDMILSQAEQQGGGSDATAFGEQLARQVADYIRARMTQWSPQFDGGEVIVGSRLAELAAGLITTSDYKDWLSDEAGRGYRPLLSELSDLSSPSSRLVLHFTCLEMADGEGAEVRADSIAQTLVTWLGEEAARQGITIKGENALAASLGNPKAWERMRSHLGLGVDPQALYAGLTILRMPHVLSDPVALAELTRTIAMLKERRSDA